MVAALLARLGQASALFLLLALAAPVARAGADRADAIAARGPVTNLPLPRFVSMRADMANARRGPSYDQRVDWEFVRRGLPLEVTAEYGPWRRVRDADGYGGWVHHTLLSGLRTALVRTDAPIALQSGPEPATAVRAMAEPGVIGRLETCAGEWCEIAVSGIDGWVPRTALWGVGAQETIE
jgi:SH3-like domain-containing protein